jgi:hypothetical protein
MLLQFQTLAVRKICEDQTSAYAALGEEADEPVWIFVC